MRFAYKYVFDLGAAVDPLDAARRLLDTDLGIAAVGLHPDDVYVARRFATIGQSVAELSALQEAESRLSQGLWPYLRFMSRQPRLLVRMARALLAAHRDDTQPEPEADEPSGTRLSGSIEELSEAMREVPFLQQLQVAMDRRRLTPGYLARLPYCRVELQPLFGRVGTEEVALDAHLLLHRTGTCVLTFWWQHDGRLSTDKLIKARQPPNKAFDQLLIAADIVKAGANMWRAEVAPPQQEREINGVEFWQYEADDERIGLSPSFEVYSDAVRTHVLGRDVARHGLRNGDWFCYPITFATTPRVARFDKLTRHQRAEVGGVAAGYEAWRSAPQELLEEWLGANWAVSPHKAVHFSGGSMVVLHGGGTRTHADADDLEWSGLADYMLQRYWSARTLDQMALGVSPDPGAVQKLSQQFLLASIELLGPPDTSWGTTNEMVERADVNFGVPELISSTRERIAITRDVVAAHVEERQARRDVVLQFVAAAATVVLGLPAIHEVVELLASIASPEWAAEALQPVKRHPALATALPWLALCVTTALVLVWGLRRPRGGPPLAERAHAPFAGPFPYQWPGRPVEVRFEDQSEGAPT